MLHWEFGGVTAAPKRNTQGIGQSQRPGMNRYTLTVKTLEGWIFGVVLYSSDEGGEEMNSTHILVLRPNPFLTANGKGSFRWRC